MRLYFLIASLLDLLGFVLTQCSSVGSAVATLDFTSSFGKCWWVADEDSGGKV